MADANAEIKVNIDTSNALSSLKLLQAQISAFQQQMARSGAQAARTASDMQQNLVNNINATGQFSATLKNIQTDTEAFTTSLEKNKLSLGQYFKYAGGASKSFGKMFRTEFDTIQKVAVERVKDLQTQYIQLGRDANGAMRSIAVRPLALDMENLGTKTQIAAQKQQLLNQLLKQGSTNLLNFGKNTQWAGRQLMVGFTIPLAMLGTTAAKTFMDMEEQVIKFKRVYGDLGTTIEETNRMSKEIQNLATQFTQYGVAVKDTMALAAQAAASGKMGADLTAQVTEATRLAVLGQVDQQQALETTISLTNAFGVSADKLKGKINFLNTVENQTVTSIEDLTIAIPKAGPVVEQLGGNVEDLTFFLTAMKEGGINASEGANALKSGLAAIINPTGKASEMLAGFGINIKGLVDSNKGDVKGLIMGLATALNKLDPTDRARAIEQMFGKFQFARISTLFKNVVAEGSQATRVLELTKSSSMQLAALASQELDKVSQSPMFKFKKAVEDIKTSLMPVGEEFLKLATPVIEFGTKVLDAFNKLDSGTKQFMTGLIAVVAGIGPVLLMTFGLIANGVANVIKGFAFIKNVFNRAGTASTVLGEQVSYMTQEQLNAAAVASSLKQSHTNLTQAFNVEAGALANLRVQYERTTAAQMAFSGTNNIPRPGTRRFATGGMVRGPGNGTSDSIPAMVSNGEFIVSAKRTKQYLPLLQNIASGKVPGFASPEGGSLIGSMSTNGIKASQATIFSIKKIIEAISSGAIKINKSEEVLAKTMQDLGDGTRTTMQRFFQRLAVNADEIAGQSVANQVNTYHQKTLGKSGKAIRYSASGVGTIEQQLGDAGRLDELARARARLEAESALGLPGQIQIDRAHRVDVGKSGKLFKQGWTSEAWNPQTHSENAISNALSGDNRVTGFFEMYSKNLKKMLDEGLVTQEEYDSIMHKAKNNLALSERELLTQSKVLKEITKTEQEFLAKNKALSYNIQRARAGASISGGLETSGNAGSISREAEIVVMQDLEAAKKGIITGIRKKTKTNSPSIEAEEVGKDIGQGFLDGGKEKIDDAILVGENLADSVVQGARKPGSRRIIVDPNTMTTQAGANMGGNGRGGKRRSGQRAGHYENGKFYPVMNYQPGDQPVPGMYDQPLGPAAPTRKQKLQMKVQGFKNNLTTKAKNLTGLKVGGALGGASMVAGMAGMAGVPGMGELSGVLGVMTMFSGTIAKVIPHLLKFIPGIGLAVTAISAFVIVSNLINDAKKKELQEITALGNAATLTKDQLTNLGNKFGISASGNAFDLTTSGATTSVGAKQRSDLEILKKDETFQNDFKQTIETLKTSNNMDASVVLKSLAIQLQGSGFAKEQIDTIVTAIKEEAKKTDLVIDLNKIDINTKSGQTSLQKTAKGLVNQLNKAVNTKGAITTEQIRGQGTGVVKVIGKDVFSKDLEEKIDKVSKTTVVNLGYITTGLQNGQISSKAYKKSIDGLRSSILSLGENSKTTQILMAGMIKNSGMGKAAQDLANSIKDASTQLLVLQGYALGLQNFQFVANAQAVLDDPKATADAKERATEAIDKYDRAIKRKIAQNAKNAQDEANTLMDTPSASDLTAQEDARIKALEAKLKALNKERDALKEINAELKRQQDFELAQQQRYMDMKTAYISGDYLKAGILRQESVYAKAQFDKETADIKAEKKISLLENRISEIEGGARPTAGEIKKSKRMATGGLIKGPGTGTSDSILGTLKFAAGGIAPIRVSNGEFITRAASVAKYGVDFMNSVNNGSYNTETSGSSSVYNVSMTINGAGQNADEIANKVISKLNNLAMKNNKSNRVIV
jgi:TP901 family phage tail tape measure protein